VTDVALPFMVTAKLAGFRDWMPLKFNVGPIRNVQLPDNAPELTVSVRVRGSAAERSTSSVLLLPLPFTVTGTVRSLQALEAMVMESAPPP